jgi:hydrogenase/urease accessory protein HupE
MCLVRARGWLTLLAILAGAMTRAAMAHPLAPVLLDLRVLDDGRVTVTWKTPLLRARGSAPVPVLPSACRSLDTPVSTTEGEGVVMRWTARCDDLVGTEVGITGLASSLGGVVRIVLADGRVVQGVVSARRPFVTVTGRPRRWDVARGYLVLGAEHIAAGPDHLLFVFGLVLLAGTARRVLGTVTAFTVGHSVTLSLAVLGVTAVSTRAIEVAIAASVLALAIELAREDAESGVLRRHPWGMAFVFGLLHGLGFAGALREAGLPAGEVPLALAAFNVGIELGQVAFVLAILAAGALLRAVAPAPPVWARRAPVYVMGSLAAFWCFERAAAWWG